MYKKSFFCIIILVIIFMFNGCIITGGNKPIKYDDLEIKSSLHDINFVYDIENERPDKNPDYIIMKINKDKEEFFEEVKSNQYYLERYNDTVIFYKTIDNKSAYFIIKYYRFLNGLHEYICIDCTAGYWNEELKQSVGFDFPNYVIQDNNHNNLYDDTIINCDFDYILEFYSRMEYIIKEQAEDYIIIEGYQYYYNEELYEEQYIPTNVKIQKKDEKTITTTIVEQE